MSDQPYTAEDGFLPVGMSGEGKATISHYVDELHSHEYLWESADVGMYDDDEQQGYTDDEKEEEEQLEDEEESGVILGVTGEPGLDELGFGEKVLVEEKESNQLKEDGSGYIVQEFFSESEEEEEEDGFEEDEISDVQQAIHQEDAEVLHHWVEVEQMLSPQVSPQRELQPLEGEEENRKHTGRVKEDDASEVEVEEEDDDGLEDLVGDRERTWYFRWR